jgi:GNAT superfamily N-acetyltransferase
LENKSPRLDDIVIVSAADMEERRLIAFYREAFPTRIEFLKNHWRWLNRSSWNGCRAPLVAVHKDRIVAHVGMMPFRLNVDGLSYLACWGIDFYVDADFRRLGLGTLILNRILDGVDVMGAFVNEQSAQVVKKMGWIERAGQPLHFFPLRPFSHGRFHFLRPAFLRRIANTVLLPFLQLRYRRYADSPRRIVLEKLNPQSLPKFLSSLRLPAQRVFGIRDQEYFGWRLLQSPDRDRYVFFHLEDDPEHWMIMKKCQRNDISYLDIMLVSDSKQRERTRRMIATLALWGLRHNAAYLRYFTTDRDLSRCLKSSLKPFTKLHRLTFCSRNRSLMPALETGFGLWELIDSDFEEF